MIRVVLLLITLILVSARRAPPPKKGSSSAVGGRWGTPATCFDLSLPVEEDLAKDLQKKEESQGKVKQVKKVKKHPKLVQSAMPGPMPGPALFGFPPIIGLEQGN